MIFYDPESFYDENDNVQYTYKWEKNNTFCREGDEHQVFKIAEMGGFDNNIYENNSMDSPIEFNGFILYNN